MQKDKYIYIAKPWIGWSVEAGDPSATANYRPVLSSERASQNNKPTTVFRKFQGERKIGHGP
jgi:hypothetical protein